MARLRSSRRLFTRGLVPAFALFFAGCGGGGEEVKHAEVQPGKMPEGAEWQGVYYSPLYGYLHILEDGDSVNGGWRTASGEAFGELSGKIDGNLLRYSWKERKIGAVGAAALKQGKGYFVYVVPKEGEAHEIAGEWGLGESDAGNTWKAVKQTNMPPDLDSVRPDEYEGRVSGGGWDQEGGGEGDSGSSDDQPTEDTSQ